MHIKQVYRLSKTLIIKLKCIWNKYINYEKLRTTSSSGICKITYHNSSYVLKLTLKLQN